MGGLQLPPPQGTWCPRSGGDLAGAGQPGRGWGRHLQQGQPDGVGETPPPAAPRVRASSCIFFRGGPKSLPEALGRQGDRRVPPEAQVEQRLPRPKNTQ